MARPALRGVVQAGAAAQRGVADEELAHEASVWLIEIKVLVLGEQGDSDPDCPSGPSTMIYWAMATKCPAS
ncbi:hypothetical protein [Streptomyces sp. SLBN-31]|uniref:hypothetical protein n=1 Tax=Streptomyces sp. SLBN-31 TaxID=2768444 RepID=UPI001154CBB0|nr:hypothetical protein [Streptomyces sp. SLBN-31]